MTTRARRAVLAGLAAVVVLVIALGVVAVLIPGERVAAAVAARAEGLLGRPVRIGDVDVRLLPLPRVRLSGVAVGAGEGADTLAAAQAVELRVRLLPLLRGDVVIGSLTLQRPRLLVEVDSAGRLGLPLLRGDTALDGQAPARDIAFAVHRVAVYDGLVTVRDRRDGARVRVAGWDQRLRIAASSRGGRVDRFELAGWLEVDDLDATLPNVVVPVRNAAFRLTHEAVLDRAADRLDLPSLQLLTGGVRLEGSGAVDSLSSATGRTADATLRGDAFEPGPLAGLFPDWLRSRLAAPGGRPLMATGAAAVRVDISGPLRADSMPGIDGRLTVMDLRVMIGEALLAEQVRLEVGFTADSVTALGGGALLGERFSLAVAVREPGSPTAVLAFTGRADLARLADIGLASDTLPLAGTIRAQVRGLLPLRDLAASRAAGTIALSGLRLGGADPALTLPSGTITLNGSMIRLDPATLRIGADGDLAVRAELDGWIPLLADSAAPLPFVAAEVTADTLDLDRLLGPPESVYSELLFARLQDRPLQDGRTAAEAAEAAQRRIPRLPPVDAEVRFRADRIVRNVLAYERIDATARVRPEGAELLAASFAFMGGTVRAAGRLTPTSRDSTGAPDRARVSGTYALTDVSAAQLFNRLTPFRDHLAGDMDLAGTLAVDLDHHALPERATTRAQGSIAISNGRLASWRVLTAVGRRLGLATLDTVRFRDWAGSFGVTGPLVLLEDTGLDGRGVSARVAGSFDFGGRLDLGATLYLDRDHAARAAAIGEQFLAAAGGRVPVGLRIHGSAEAPGIQLDLSDDRGSLVESARAAGREEARQIAGRAADAVLPDSLLAPPDSVRRQARNALRNRLRSLFGGG